MSDADSESPRPSARGRTQSDAGAVELDAYAELYTHYAPRVRGYLVRRGLADSAAQEVAQEVMLAVWRKRETYDADRASLSTWVFTIARNRCIDHLRKGARSEPDPSDPCWVQTVAERPKEPEERVMTASRDATLGRALASLDDEQREALRNLYFEGRTANETAADAGVPIGTIKSRARRALEALRKKLRGGELDDA